MARQHNNNKNDKKAPTPDDTEVISAKRRRKPMILEQINTPSAAVPGSDLGEGVVCPIIPVDLSVVTELPPLFALEELGINLDSIGLEPGETLTPTAKEYLDELLVDYFGDLQKLFGNGDFADNFNQEDVSTWPSLEDLVKVPPPPATVPPVELPDVPGAVDSLPPPATVPIDPPGSYVNDGGENTERPVEKVYDFPTRNQPLVGVIDTGMGASNPDIDYSRVTSGYDRVGRDRNPLLRPGEGNQHGSHVLGIIGATRNNGVGIDGINDKAPLWVGRAIGSGQWAESLREFVDAAKRSGQKNAIANLSLDLTQRNRDGSVTTRYKFTPAERQAIKYAQDNGVLIVAAAGNDGDVMSVLGQASQEFDNIITVGAADGDNRAAYSSYGNGLDILAPGGTADSPVTSTVGDGLGTMAGTSVATAKVTGAASLVWAANPSLNFSQVKEILKATAQDLGAAGWDEETGAGLLDLDGAVEQAKVTRGRSYTSQQPLISSRWNIDSGVTAGERAVQDYDITRPDKRRVYYGVLNGSNPSDKLYFTLNRPSNLQFAFPNTGGSAKVYSAFVLPFPLTTARPQNENPGSLYSSVDLMPGRYYMKVDKGSRSTLDYGLIMNFDHQNPDNGFDSKHTLPRPVLSNNSSFNKTTPPPPKDTKQIEKDNAARLAKLQRQALEKQEREEAEKNARDAIDLAEKKNDWLGGVQPNGQRIKDVEFDWNTRMDNRVAAIKYFDNGYIIWNGIHAVAYHEGAGTSRGEEAQADPRQVRLHDWGLHNGRVEYGTYIGESKRDDYYKFSVEELKDLVYNSHKLQFALRNSSGGISSKDAQFQILDEDFKPISLNQRWQPEKNTGEVGLAYLDTLRDGQTYYVRVKPEKDNLDYQVIMNLDSAGQDKLYPPRNVGSLKGRQQFRDYIGNKGDANGDYYKFYLQDKSFLRFSLGELEPGSKIKAEILDKDNRVVPLNYFDGSYGDVTLDKGHYYLRLLPEGDTSTNYLLTTQMAEELGEYTGRHEFQNRSVWEDEAYYRFTVGEQGARDFHLKLKQKEGFTNVELRRDVGGGIVNSELVTPDVSQGNPQGAKKLFFVGANKGNGKDDLYRRYDNLPPGRYIVKVNLDSDFESYAEYDLVMNMDLAGNSLETARNLGDLSGERVELKDFVGRNKGDDVDFYKFTTDNREFRLQFALREMTGAPHIDVLDERGNAIPLNYFDGGGSDRYGSVVIPPDGTYYLRVKAPDNPDDSTNYKLVVNATDDVGIILKRHKVDGDIYKVFKEHRGTLGDPKSGSKDVGGVKYQEFDNGWIVSSKYGTHPIWWGMKDAYLNKYGGIGGDMGVPTGTEERIGHNKVKQSFANGYIIWNNGSTTAYNHDGSRKFPPPPPPSYGGGNATGVIDAVNKVNPDQWYYRPRNMVGDARNETFCNWFVADVLELLGVPIPRHNQAMYPPVFEREARNKPLLANDLYDKLNTGLGGKWRKINAAEAVSAANNGQVVLASAYNRSGPGHIAIVIPGGSGSNVRIAQAGARNGKNMSVGQGFGSLTPSYFVYTGKTNISSGGSSSSSNSFSGSNAGSSSGSNNSGGGNSGGSNNPPKVELPRTGGDNSSLPDINSLSLYTNDPNLAAVYRIGSPAPPEIKHDKGFSEDAGKEEPTWKDHLIRQKWINAARLASTYLPDGAAAYFHYVDGKGADRHFSYEKFVKDDENGKIALNNLILDAQAGVENLYRQIISKYPAYAGREVQFNISSGAIVVGDKEEPRFPYPQTENWQKAIGGHSVWLSASAIVTPGQPASYELDFTLHAEDRYNFDKGKKDIASGAKDEENGRLVVVGLAHEYMNYSTLSRYVTWKQGNLNNATTTDGPVRR